MTWNRLELQGSWLPSLFLSNACRFTLELHQMKEMNSNIPRSGQADDEWSSPRQTYAFPVHREQRSCLSHTSRTILSQIEPICLSPSVTGVCERQHLERSHRIRGSIMYNIVMYHFPLRHIHIQRSFKLRRLQPTDHKGHIRNMKKKSTVVPNCKPQLLFSSVPSS